MSSPEPHLGLRPKVETKGRSSAGKKASFGHKMAALLTDITLTLFVVSSAVYFLTHPTSPLESMTREIFPRLQKRWGAVTSQQLLDLLQISVIPLVAGAGIFFRALPSLGRSLIGIQEGLLIAGGGNPIRLLLALSIGLIAAGGTLSVNGHGPVFSKTLSVTEPRVFPFNEELEKDLNWTLLPFFQLAGRWPIVISNQSSADSSSEGSEVGRILVGYAQGIVPDHYLPSVTFQWEQQGIQLRIEGPKRSSDQTDSLRELRGTQDSCGRTCLALIQSQRLQMKAILGTESIQAVQVIPWKGSAIQGILLHIRTKTFHHWRALIELPGDTMQSLTWSEKRDPVQDSDSVVVPPILRELLANLGANPSLQEARRFTNERLGRVNLRALLGEHGGVRDLTPLLKTSDGRKEIQSRKDALQGVQHLLLAKLTVEPSSSETFLHLAGTSYLLWKVAIALSDSGTSATARKVIRVTERYLQDFAQKGAAELKAVRDILQEIEAFERK